MGGREAGHEVERGQIMLGVRGPGTELGFYFKSNGKPLEGLRQNGCEDEMR